MSTATANRQFRLAARPVGLPKNTDWELTTEPVPEPGEGEVLVQLQFISLDPAMRGWMNDVRSYLPPVKIGEVMRAGGAGRVVKSSYPGLQPGDHVIGTFGVQEYAVVKGEHATKVDVSHVPLASYVGALGMTGMTAYFGLLEVGAAKPGNTVVVSGAAGAVGSVVGQVAKNVGCRVIGIAGGPEKCRFVVEELGFDACIDYKADNVAKKLRELCPKGLDVYFDNVGGDILDAALANLAMHARVVICGAISQYNSTGGVKGPSNYMNLLVMRSRMEGFLVFDFAARFPEGVKAMAGWMREGKLVSREDIVNGFESFPATFLKLFSGDNTGKLLLGVAE